MDFSIPWDQYLYGLSRSFHMLMVGLHSVFVIHKKMGGKILDWFYPVKVTRLVSGDLAYMGLFHWWPTSQSFLSVSSRFLAFYIDQSYAEAPEVLGSRFSCSLDDKFLARPPVTDGHQKKYE